MKKIFLVILFLANLNIGFAQTDYLSLSGRSSALSTVKSLVDAINQTGLPVYTYQDNGDGNYFTYAYIRDGKIIISRRIHLSNQIIENLKKNLANPQTGESILQVCGQQAKGFTDVHNATLFRPVTVTTTVIEKEDCKCDPVITTPAVDYVDYDIYRNSRGSSVDTGIGYVDYNFNKQFQNQDHVKEKTWFGRNWGWFVPTVIAVGVGTYYGINALDKPSRTEHPKPESDPEYFPGNENSQYFPPPKAGGGFVIFSF